MDETPGRVLAGIVTRAWAEVVRLRCEYDDIENARTDDPATLQAAENAYSRLQGAATVYCAIAEEGREDIMRAATIEAARQREEAT